METSLNNEKPISVEVTIVPIWWKILGIKRRPGKFIPIGLRWWAVGVYGLLIGGGVMFGFAEYSMQPDFCRSCHIMEPYYKAWHESTHNDIPCVDCHFEPGFENTIKGKWQASAQVAKYLTRTYGSKPHAEIRDDSCLREGCHEHRLLDGLAEWEVPTQRGDTIKIHFNHTPHLGELRRGKQLRCVSCHSQIVQGQHLVVTLDTCFTCHFKGVKHGRDEEVLGGCGSCHGAPKGDIRLATGIYNHQEYVDRHVPCEDCHSEAIKGDGEVPRQLCWTCHNQPQQLAKYGETQLMHRAHVTDHKLECSNCHVQIEHSLNANPNRALTLAQMDHLESNSPEGCGQCHEGTHSGPAKMYSGTGGHGIPDMPSPMFTAQVDCIACHTEVERGASHGVTGMTYIAAQQACTTCHGNRYDGVLDVWKNGVELQLMQAQEAVAKAKAALANAIIVDDQQRLELQRLVNDAEENVEFVRTSHGVHNINYATALLSLAMDHCQQIEKRLGTATDEAVPEKSAPAEEGSSP